MMIATQRGPTDPPKRPAEGSDDPKWRRLNSVRILVVDDDEQVTHLLARFVRRQGYAVRVATTARQALELLAEWPADLLIADLLMPEMDGIELMRTVKEEIDLPVIAISGGGRIAANVLLRTAELLGAAGVLEKPFSSAELAAAIQAALE